MNNTQYGHDIGGGCYPHGTICAREDCLSMQASLRKHSMPRATIDGLFHGDKPEAAQTGIKFGEVGVVKSSACACHAYLRQGLFIMPAVVVIMS